MHTVIDICKFNDGKSALIFVFFPKPIKAF